MLISQTLGMDEAQRLTELSSYALLDTPAESHFDELAMLASTLCGTPIALVSIADSERQWFKSSVGMAVPEVPRAGSFCDHAMLSPAGLIVEDASVDPRFAKHALVTGEPHIRFYAGAPLVTSSGAVLGTICVMDCVPRKLSQAQIDALAILARQVVSQLELQRAERKLRHEADEGRRVREQLEVAANAGRLAVWHWSLAEQKIQYIGSWEEMLGYRPGELPQDLATWSRLIHPDDLPLVHAAVAEHQSKRTAAYRVEHRCLAKDGSYRWILGVGAVVERNAADEPLRMCGVRFDVTENKMLNAQLAHAERTTALGTLAAGVAHEVNNPLTVVLGNIGIAKRLAAALERDGQLPPDERKELLEALGEVSQSATRVRDVVRDLNSFTRSDLDSVGPVRLVNVLESSIHLARHELKHRATVVRRYDHAPTLVASEHRLGELFVNLLFNAAHAIPIGAVERHTVTVHVWVEGDQAFIEISDNGVGIAPDVLTHIFDPFFTTKNETLGTGLGLAICHRVAQIHGGDLSAESTLGGRDHPSS